MAQRLRALAALAEDPIHTCDSQPPIATVLGDPTLPSSLQGLLHTHSTLKTHTGKHKFKN